MKRIIAFIFLFLFLLSLSSLAMAGSADKGMSFSKPPSQPRFNPPRTVPVPPVVQPAPPAVSQAPVQRREIIIRREERIHTIQEFRDRRRPVFFGNGFVSGPVTEIAIFPSSYVLMGWRGLPYYAKPPVCYRTPAHWEEREQIRQTALGFETIYLERIWIREEVCR